MNRQNVWSLSLRRIGKSIGQRRAGAWGVRGAAAAALLAFHPAPADAQAAAPSAEAQQARLLERIRLLERRLEQLERAPQTPRPPRATAAAAAPPPAPPTAPPAMPPSRTRDPHDEEIPQEAFVFRDQAVTLRPGQAEASLDLGYLRDRRIISADRSASAVLTARLGIMAGVEAAITAPFFQSTRSFERSPSLISDRETRGIGDVSAQVNILGWGERPFWPGAVFTAAVVTPTGPSPFISPATGLSAELVPVDITQAISTRGAWALRSGVQFFKTVDPLVLFGGVSYEYVFPLEQSGITFRPGRRINYNAGISFALSERSTLGFTFIGSYTSALQANSITYRNTASESAALRLSLVQRLGTQFWLEPALAFGLVSDSPNVQLGLGLRYRF
ncbi:hypothetical protein [Sediminicoccus sp. KRV36]|uniref:hypothetical protein n=1 Tax=Sediminicoccus sp. KRV36 TaxID=3133721 RepID=UPI00200F198C|nr:hypothetical protein [Sediminicoccus rosea]UPY36157.1 hypothetical protein LHU95_18345 [Sediminicoccus rosea]